MKRDKFLRLLKWAGAKLERLSDISGKAVSWLVLALVLVIVYDVAMRYFFSRGSVALQELQWHLFAVIFLLGAAYTLKHDDHVRIDVLYKSAWMNAKRRAWINLFGSLLLLTPFCIVIILTSLPFVAQSYIHLEGSPDPGGLPWRWLLRAMIPLGFLLLLLQGLAGAVKDLLTILEED